MMLAGREKKSTGRQFFSLWPIRHSSSSEFPRARPGLRDDLIDRRTARVGGLARLTRARHLRAGQDVEVTGVVVVARWIAER